MSRVEIPMGFWRSSRAQQNSERLATDSIDRNDFAGYQVEIIHSWLRTITALTMVLVPLFFVLDIFIAPEDLLPLFAIYRASSTLLALIQHIIVRTTKPSRFSYFHGYFVSLQVGGAIALMTVSLGGFASGYYVGLIMVIIGVNLLMPWQATHTAANAALILTMYLGLNLGFSDESSAIDMANNLFFLAGTSVISVAINHVRYLLIQSEFSLLVQLKQARDALWSEMELAKQVQVSLLPRSLDITGYKIAVSFVPARDVGGDYYDVIETEDGVRYLAIGDVAGHGLDSGLIMMMAQTAVMTVVRGSSNASPAEVLRSANAVLRENVGRLGSNHYMTMTIVRLADDSMTIAGHHQDILVYRQDTGQIETVGSPGTWLGIIDDTEAFDESASVSLGEGDRVLLFSDGITEATDAFGDLFGQDRLIEYFGELAGEPIDSAVQRLHSAVSSFQSEQSDDMTLIMMQRRTMA